MTECDLTEHPHNPGTRAAWIDGCRCPETITAREYRLRMDNRRAKARRVGILPENPAVTAGPAREHLARMLTRYPTHQIEAATGVTADTIRRIARGASPTIRRDTEKALLAFTGTPRPAEGIRARRGYVDAHPSTLRLQALSSMGWTVGPLADFGTIPPGDDPDQWRARRIAVLSNLTRGIVSTAPARIVDDIATAYAALRNTHPVPITRGDRAAIAKAQHRARRNRWPFPSDLDAGRTTRE